MGEAAEGGGAGGRGVGVMLSGTFLLTLFIKDCLSTSWPGSSRPSTSLISHALQDVDARDMSAFTRVFDALCAGMTSGELCARG